MNYLYSKLEYDGTFDINTPERRAFKEHLALVAKALHDIEWVDSGDYGPGDENKAIRACLAKTKVLEAPIQHAEETLQELKDEIFRAKVALGHKEA